MTRKDILNKFLEVGVPLYGVREASSIAYLALEKLFGVSRLDIVLEPNAEVACDGPIDSVLLDIKRGRPIQYILSEAFFCGLSFNVAEGVLIPRPETEELVDWIVKENGNDRPDILDIGTGSGAIAVALASQIVGSSVTAIDISERALEIASANADFNQVRILFEQADILSLDTGNATWAGRKYDVIVSNPPYIPRSDTPEMHLNVTGFEPGEALFVDDSDPLVFYRAIAERAVDMLKERGSLYFEIHERFAQEVSDLLEQLNYTDIVVKVDINEKQRMVRCRR